MFLSRTLSFVGLMGILLTATAACTTTAPGGETARVASAQPVALSTPVPNVNFPSPPPGAYRYSTLRGEMTETRSAANPLVRQRSDGVVYEFDSCGRQLRRSGGLSLAVTFSPHNGQLPCEPLNVGVRWTHDYRITFGSTVQTRQRVCSVAGHERLVVAAGSFDAARVECTNASQSGASSEGTEVSHYRVADRLPLRIVENGPNQSRVELLGTPN